MSAPSSKGVLRKHFEQALKSANTQQSKRICHISTVHPLDDVRVFYRECCSLVQAGYEVHLVVRAEKPTTKEGVHVHPITPAKSRILRMLFTPWVAMFQALRTKASIFHYHDPELIVMGFVLRWALRKKVIFDIHESVAHQIMSKSYLPSFTRRAVSCLYKLLERIFISGQNLIIANSNSFGDYSSRKYLVQNYPLLRQEIIAGVSDVKQRGKVPSLVYVGSVSKIRGAMVYVQLAGKLAERGYGFRMDIIGQYSEELGKELRSRIEELHVQDKVTLRGRLDWTEAMHCVSNATIGLCLLFPVPNYTSCLATKIIEYMMLGTPVLASDFDCWRDFVEGEMVGRMVNPADINEVVDVCIRMLENMDELSEMGRRGMEAVRRKYNWSTEFKELLRCYEQLLDK